MDRQTVQLASLAAIKRHALNGGPFGSSRVLSFYLYEQALSEYGYRMGYGAAIAVILFLIMMVFITGFIWKMVRDERAGG